MGPSATALLLAFSLAPSWAALKSAPELPAIAPPIALPASLPNAPAAPETSPRLAAGAATGLAPQLQSLGLAPALPALERRPERAPQAAPSPQDAQDARASLGAIAQGTQRPGPEVAAALDAAFDGQFLYDSLGATAPVMPRDPKLTNSLLHATRALGDWARFKAQNFTGQVADLADSILTGDYLSGARHVEGLAARRPEDERAAAALASLRGLLPKADLAEAAVLRAALAEVRAAARADPFQLQERLSALVHGILDENIPEDLNDLQVWLTKKASGLARSRAAQRQAEKISGPLQKKEECWLNSLYHLPSPALDALRKRVDYKSFLKLAAEAFPHRDVLEDGLTLEQFRALLDAQGLKLTTTRPNAEGLKSLLGRHGGVLAAIGWFDKDATGLPFFESVKLWHQHAVAITGWEDAAEGPLFKVRDSLVPRHTRYTMAELDANSLLVFVVEPK